MRALPDEKRKSLTEHFWRCDYCGRIAVVWKVYPDHEMGDLVRDPLEVRLVWPDRAPRELPESAPDDMRSLFREASIAENAGALRGAAALYRAAVEALVADQGVQGGDLYSKIDALESKGVDPDILRDLHEARLLGNWSLHQGVAFGAAEVADVAALIADAVRILYVMPAMREAMREARQKRREAASGKT